MYFELSKPIDYKSLLLEEYKKDYAQNKKSMEEMMISVIDKGYASIFTKDDFNVITRSNINKICFDVFLDYIKAEENKELIEKFKRFETVEINNRKFEWNGDD